MNRIRAFSSQGALGKKKLNAAMVKIFPFLFFSHLKSGQNKLISHGPITAWMEGCSLHRLKSGPQFGHAHTDE